MSKNFIGKKKGSKSRKSRKSKKWMYRRRRAVALVAALAALAVVIFCVVSLIRGAVRIHENAQRADTMALTRGEAPQAPKKSNVPDCGPNDVNMTLTPSSTSTGVGGAIDFTATISYTGSSPSGCFVNGADDERVLVITSGNDTVWRSDACEAQYRPLLMFAGQKDEQQIVWNTTRSSNECVAEADLPHVDRGTYVARLVMKDNPKVASDPVTVTVE
ncbi:hypothetical protein [Bifidobacterium gallicum]|nr:hypothetical protein [Bifidobacterium gallicum]EFA22957.1 hypothetical protein BIFGAL_03060 [Bifidobacterium gallicum DSM 20093 = LMG 11596]